ncbi:protein phosphatase [Marivita sp. GX14005]|uniref:protein phosphatase n=1 Tax=Marivita sp. GX14005 TaxID=2942276 RepID=UPI002018E9AF|nr:protein phosphatase [Marivita sp. GX14005]MCL3880999.1 protein phosphatase [Marivita sp. GX14005]
MIVYALPVDRGILGLSRIPGLEGDFRGDVEHLKEWKPAMVLSLVTDVELVAAGAAELGRLLVEAGTRWEQPPIGDGAGANEAFDAIWPRISENARRALVGGGRVLLHSRRGCGRSGMVALRLMIELGEAPDEALSRLRGVRPCAIETAEQMQWARRARREPAVFLRHDGER